MHFFRLCWKAHCTWSNSLYLNLIITCMPKETGELQVYFYITFSHLLSVSKITKYLEVLLSTFRVIQRYILYWNWISVKIIQNYIFLFSIQFILISEESGCVWLHNFLVQYIGHFGYFKYGHLFSIQLWIIYSAFHIKLATKNPSSFYATTNNVHIAILYYNSWPVG